jgi:hypothetical protein
MSAGPSSPGGRQISMDDEAWAELDGKRMAKQVLPSAENCPDPLSPDNPRAEQESDLSP